MDALIAAYGPSSAEIVALVLTFPALSLLLGHAVTRIPSVTLARVVAWTWTLGSFLALERLIAEEAPGFRMLALCYALLLAMKVAVANEDARVYKEKLSYLRWLLWAGLWPGMKTGLFSPKSPSPNPQKGWALIKKGIVRLIAGAILVALSRLIYTETQSAPAATPSLLVGISLILHFGLFNLLAGAWCLYGFQTETLFPHPLASKTLSEFWGKRWNLPFTEMCQSALNKPLTPVLGRNTGAMAAFLYSGIVHEFAISIPVQEGYGLPLLYFLVHGLLILCERKFKSLKDTLKTSFWGHVWCVFWLASPMFILFHPAFLKGVVWPLIGIPQ